VERPIAAIGGNEGGRMESRKLASLGRLLALLCVAAFPAAGQSFRVQCPTNTITHPNAASNNSEPAYTGPTAYTCTVANGCGGTGTGNLGYLVPSGAANGAIKCQQISGGDGYSTMGDGTQTYMFSFGPLSGLTDIASGKPGTEFPSVFNTPFPCLTLSKSCNPLQPGDPATTGLANFITATGDWNGAVGLVPDIPYVATIYDISESGNTVTVVLNTQSFFQVGDTVVISGTGGSATTNPRGFDGTFTVTATPIPNPFFAANFAFQYHATVTGLAEVTESTTATAASVPGIDGHVDPRPIMDVGVMNGNIPAPLFAIDEDDEFFLTLTNVGMIMRPDLFEQHTVHFHGYPNASAFYDGVPDASVAINIGASFTYYYLAPDAGTYFWHCHITPPEHLQMGMVGQLYVRPRQNRVASSSSLYASLQKQQGDPRTACRRPGDESGTTLTPVTAPTDILCSNPLPATSTSAMGGAKYAYNDGDGSTAYDVEYPLQIHGFDPNFHFVGMTFNPEGFADMKDKYFLLNGRSYPDTVIAGPLQTMSSDGKTHFSQPLDSIISIPVGKKALLRISDLDVSEYQTLASIGIPMHVIGYNAKLLRDQAGNNLDYYTNSITLGGGESLDVILDASDTAKYKSGQIFYLYTPNLDHLSNDAENYGGLMTEIRIQ
jgi:FtsP/CotA-like multicopper oxidase with cupredoxin domain